MGEFKSRGGNWIIRAIFLLIVATIVYFTVVPDGAITTAPLWRKLLGFPLIISAFIVFMGGDRIFGAGKSAQDPNWKGDYWRWVVISVALFIVGMSLLVLHGGPLRG